MAEYFDLVKSLQELLTNRFTPKLSYTTGLLGDGLGNVAVPDRPDKSYARFNRASTNYFEIFNVTTPHINNWPVLIGEYPWQPGLTQVIGTDWEAYQQSGWGDSFGGNSPHAPTHEWPDGSPGSDPLNVYLRSIVPFRTYAGSTGTTIYTNAYEYEYQGSGHVWGGVPGIDLSPVVSSMSTGTMRFMGVYLNPATNLLGVVTGSTTVFTSAFDPPRVQFPGGVLPSARVRVYGSQSNITEFDFRDARQPFSVVSTGTSGGGGSPSGNAGGDLTGTYPNPMVAGLWNYPLELGAPTEGDIWMFSGSSWRHLPLSEIGGGNVWPKAGEANISDTAYTGIDDFFDALVGGVQGIIGEGSFTTDWTGGHAAIPTGADVKGSGVGVTVLTSADTNGTLEIEGESLLEQLTVANTTLTGAVSLLQDTAGNGRYDTVRATSTATSGIATAFYVFDGAAEFIDCEGVASGGASNYALWGYDGGSGTNITIRGGKFTGDIVADQAGTVIHLDGPTITGSVTEANGGTITGHYYDASGRLRRGSTQSLVYSFVPEVSAYDIMRANNTSTSDFVATIATLPGGAILTYNAPSAGDEANLVPNDTNQIAKMVLHNTTRGNNALISNCVAGTNTITLTANVPGTWQTGDTITIRSQTNTTTSGGAYFVDFEFVATDLSYFVCALSIQDSGGLVQVVLHPYEANNSNKRFGMFTQVTNRRFTGIGPPMPLIDNRFCFAWTSSGAGTVPFVILQLYGIGQTIQ